jgi:hypothetical protein
MVVTNFGLIFSDGKMKQMCCNKRYSHMDDRSQNIYPFKKRKFFSQSPLCTSDEVFHHEGMTNFPDKRNGDNQSAGATTCGCMLSFLAIFCICVEDLRIRDIFSFG